MKNIVLLLLVVSIAFSCKQSKIAEASTKTPIFLDSYEVQGSEVKIPWGTFNANGTDPGWTLEIKANDIELLYQLELEDGNIVKIGVAKIVTVNEKARAVQLETNNEIIQVQILNKECTDKTSEKTVFFTSDQKRYKGCGMFEKQPS
jgi:uncharacterized membrane protein